MPQGPPSGTDLYPQPRKAKRGAKRSIGAGSGEDKVAKGAKAKRGAADQKLGKKAAGVRSPELMTFE